MRREDFRFESQIQISNFVPELKFQIQVAAPSQAANEAERTIGGALALALKMLSTGGWQVRLAGPPSRISDRRKSVV